MSLHQRGILCNLQELLQSGYPYDVQGFKYIIDALPPNSIDFKVIIRADRKP